MVPTIGSDFSSNDAAEAVTKCLCEEVCMCGGSCGGAVLEFCASVDPISSRTSAVSDTVAGDGSDTTVDDALEEEAQTIAPSVYALEEEAQTIAPSSTTMGISASPSTVRPIGVFRSFSAAIAATAAASLCFLSSN